MRFRTPSPRSPPAPNLALIRRNATISPIDAQNIQRWVDQQVDQLFDSNNLDADAVKFRTTLLEHFEAADATAGFKKVLADSVAASLARRYKGVTSLADPQLPRPMPVIYVLLLLQTFDDPGAAAIDRQALLDKSVPPAPGIKAVAARGLRLLRSRLDAAAWAALVPDAQKAGLQTSDPVALEEIYRLLMVDTPDARVQEDVAVLRILEGRNNDFEKKGLFPCLGDGEAATWLGTAARRIRMPLASTILCSRSGGSWRTPRLRT